MNWQQIREKYPHQWVLVEAFEAYTENGIRVIPHLTVLAHFGNDSHAAWERYKSVHSADRHREHYVLHTDRETLNIHVHHSLRRSVR